MAFSQWRGSKGRKKEESKQMPRSTLKRTSVFKTYFPFIGISSSSWFSVHDKDYVRDRDNDTLLHNESNNIYSRTSHDWLHFLAWFFSFPLLKHVFFHTLNIPLHEVLKQDEYWVFLSWWPTQLSPSNDVKMKMVHRLTSIFSIIDDKSKSLVSNSFFMSQFLSNKHQMSQQLVFPGLFSGILIMKDNQEGDIFGCYFFLDTDTDIVFRKMKVTQREKE